MASKYGGYMGRVLKINLTDKSITEYPFSDSERELFIGGKTMANKILYDNLTGIQWGKKEDTFGWITKVCDQ